VASARLIVFKPKDERFANSSALHLSSARADLIWAPVNDLVDTSAHVGYFHPHG
jgi:hypothetical protein